MSNKLDKILAEISAGELFDKITILEIKKQKISNKEAKRCNLSQIYLRHSQEVLKQLSKH